METILIDSYVGCKVPQHLNQQENSKTLAVLLSGQGYSTDGPLLYYSQQLMTELGYDCLKVTYGYQVIGGSYQEEEFWAIAREVKMAIDEALKTKEYQEIIFIGKSLGTVMTTAIIDKYKDDYKVTPILLTPISQYTNQMINVPQFIAYGTTDAYVDETSRQLYRQKENVTCFVVDGGDHGLNVSDTLKSIDYLADLLSALKTYLQGE